MHKGIPKHVWYVHVWLVFTLILRAVQLGISYQVIHNASIINAVECCGLQVKYISLKDYMANHCNKALCIERSNGFLKVEETRYLAHWYLNRFPLHY